VGFANPAFPTCGSQNVFDSNIFGFWPDGAAGASNPRTGTSASVGFRREPERRPAVRFYTISGGDADTMVGGDQCKFNPAAAASLIATNRTGTPIEISADEFEFAPDSANTNRNLATYSGHVLVTDEGRMRLTCERLTGKMPAGANQMESVVAERRVELEIHESLRDGSARGDKAVYTASNGEVVVTRDDGVEIAFQDPKINGRGKGTSAVYAHETDVLKLTGNPVLTTQYGQAWGDIVMLDHANTTLKATGNWKLQLNAEALNKAVKPAPQTPLSKPTGSRPADSGTRF